MVNQSQNIDDVPSKLSMAKTVAGVSLLAKEDTMDPSLAQLFASSVCMVNSRFVLSDCKIVGTCYSSFQIAV